jgi:hypothetical protein
MGNPKENERKCEVVVLISYVNAGTIQVARISETSGAPSISTQTSLADALDRLYEAGFVLQHADEVNVNAPDAANNALGIQYTFVKCRNNHNHNCWC